MFASSAARVGLSMVLIAVLGSACGSSTSSTDPGGTTTNTTPCSLTLTGAVSNTNACTGGAVAGYITSTNVSGFSLQYTAPLNSTTLATTLVIIYFSGIPAAGTTYTSVSAGAASTASVTLNADRWTETLGLGAATVGSYTLTIASRSVQASTAAGADYTVHGTLSATLLPLSSNTNRGTVTLNATF